MIEINFRDKWEVGAMSCRVPEHMPNEWQLIDMFIFYNYNVVHYTLLSIFPYTVLYFLNNLI